MAATIVLFVLPILAAFHRLGLRGGVLLRVFQAFVLRGTEGGSNTRSTLLYTAIFRGQILLTLLSAVLTLLSAVLAVFQMFLLRVSLVLGCFVLLMPPALGGISAISAPHTPSTRNFSALPGVLAVPRTSSTRSILEACTILGGICASLVMNVGTRACASFDAALRDNSLLWVRCRRRLWGQPKYCKYHEYLGYRTPKYLK